MWGIGYFRNDLYGRKFTINTDHQAFMSISKVNSGNKIYFSRMIRWIEKILPLSFEFMPNISGVKMGFPDYLQRHLTTSIRAAPRKRIFR